MDTLLTPVPFNFANKVKEQANESSFLVLEKVVERIIEKIQSLEKRDISGYSEEWHAAHPRHSYRGNYGCGCELCLLRSQYTSIKIVSQRLKRYVDNMYSIYPGPVVAEESKRLSQLESKYTLLRNKSRALVQEIAITKLNKCWIPKF